MQKSSRISFLPCLYNNNDYIFFRSEMQRERTEALQRDLEKKHKLEFGKFQNKEISSCFRQYGFSAGIITCLFPKN